MNKNLIVRSFLPLSVMLVVLGMLSGCATVSNDSLERIRVLVNNNSTNLAFYIELPHVVRIKAGEMGHIPIEIRNGYVGRGALLTVQQFGRWALTEHDIRGLIIDGEDLGPNAYQLTEVEQFGDNVPYSSAMGRTYVLLAGSERGGLDISQMYAYHYFKIPKGTKPGKYEMQFTVRVAIYWFGTTRFGFNSVDHDMILIVE